MQHPTNVRISEQLVAPVGAHQEKQADSRVRGFTIVELLIVIVVIGILDAITIVAYNGIQQRAQNAQQAVVAKSYVGAFTAYLATNGSYPPVSNARICLGINVSDCTTATTSWSRDTSQLEPALKTVVTSLAEANRAVQVVNTPKMGYVPVTNIAGNDITLDGSPRAFIIYSLGGSGTCTTGPVASGGWPNFSSTPPAAGYTFADTGIRFCFVPLPNAT